MWRRDEKRGRSLRFGPKSLRFDPDLRDDVRSELEFLGDEFSDDRATHGEI